MYIMDVRDTLAGAADQKLTVEHAARRKGLGNLGEAFGNVIAGAAEQPCLVARVDQLDPDPVPFPFGRIILEADPRLLERMGEHEH